jgi:hypothetical protein
MDDPVLARTICRQCRAALDAGDNYCRRCGVPTGTSGNSRPAIPVGAKAVPSSAQSKYWESPCIVLTLLFVVLGPFAIPLLWRSRRFTLVWKNILTTFVLGWTALLLWVLWLFMQQTFGPLLRDLNELLPR